MEFVVCSDRRRNPSTDDESVTFSDTRRIYKDWKPGMLVIDEVGRVDEVISGVLKKKHPLCINLYDKEAFGFREPTIEERSHHHGHARALIYGEYLDGERKWVNEINLHINYGKDITFPDKEKRVAYIVGDGEVAVFIGRDGNSQERVSYDDLTRTHIERFFAREYELAGFHIIGTYMPQGTMSMAGMRWSGVFFHPWTPNLEPHP